MHSNRFRLRLAVLFRFVGNFYYQTSHEAHAESDGHGPTKSHPVLAEYIKALFGRPGPQGHAAQIRLGPRKPGRRGGAASVISVSASSRKLQSGPAPVGTPVGGGLRASSGRPCPLSGSASLPRTHINGLQLWMSLHSCLDLQCGPCDGCTVVTKCATFSASGVRSGLFSSCPSDSELKTGLLNFFVGVYMAPQRSGY